MKRWKYLSIGAALSLLLAASAMAQTTFAVIRGRVLDPSGSPIPAAKVTVTNTGTNISKNLTSSDSGAYEAGYLLPGTYSVTAEAAGFKKFVAENLLLNANAVVLLDANMSVGDLSSSITVEAGAPLISTETAVISDVKTQQQYLQAPMNVRGNWDSFLYNFMSLVPGAQPMVNGFSIAFNGTRYTMNNFTVDGITTNSTLYGNQVGPANPSMDFVREVRVDMSGNSAEFSAPGYVDVVTRGGENKLHGSAYWYYNTAGWNARNTFQNRVAFAVLNDYGFSVSGPVFKNKTFFSGGMEGFNQHTATLFNLNLPSASVRKGDFSKMLDAGGKPLNLTIKDPLNNNQPFAGNAIPSPMLNSAALKTQQRFYPDTNYGNPEQVADNYRGQVKQMLRKEQVDVRIDHTFSDKNSMFGRFNAMRAPNGTWEGYLPTIGPRIQRRQTRNFVLSDTHTFRPNLINEARFGLIRGYNPYSGPIDGPTAVKEMGLTNLPANLPQVQALPTVSVSNFTQITQIAYARGAEVIGQLQDNLSWIKGRHTIKMGGEIWRNYGGNFSVNPSNAYGSINFTGDYSGYSYADFLLGIPRSGSRSSAGFVRTYSTNYDKFFFIQDDFKVNPRLTLTMGLRYELNPPWVEKEDRTYSFNPFTNQMVVPSAHGQSLLYSVFVNSNLVPIVTADKAGLPRALAYTYKKNFAPRLGFAYKLTSDNKTVVRGAYGIFYDAFTGALWRSLGGGPYNGTESITTNTITDNVPAWQWPDMFPRTINQAGTASMFGVDPHVRQPYTQQWNFTVEREFLNMGFRASYVGTKTHALVMARNLNQVLPSTTPYSASRRWYPQLSSVSWAENQGNAYYNGLTVTTERKFKSGVQYQINYTWAKNLTDSHDDWEVTASPLNAYNRRAEWGNSQFTRRHRLTFNSITELPFGRNKKFVNQGGLLDYLIGGWALSTFGVIQTGPYFTPSVSGGDPAAIGTSGGRPDRIGSGELANPTLANWFDKTAFVVPANNIGRFGNSGVNILRAPGTTSVNFGMFKKFRLRESMKLQMEATFTNVLNHPNYAAPNTTVNSASGALITSMQSLEGAGPRTTRLGMRLDF